MRKFTFIILILGIFISSASAQLLVSKVSYTISIPKKYVPFLQEKAEQEGMTVKELLENIAIGVAKSIIDEKYEAKKREVTIDDKINTISK